MSESPTELSYWPPRAKGKDFDWTLPTNVAYKVDDTNLFSPPFQESRSKLDYSYHKNPVLDRQRFQDVVLSRVLDADESSSQAASSTSPSSTTTATKDRPFIVFTSGPMGVGKSYVMSQLHKRKLFPFQNFVKIDPDMLKSELPEMAGYLQYDSESAATKLHRESTQMSDVLFEHSLSSNRNILVDGSLRDVDWYTQLFHRLRHEFPQYTLVIMYVSASTETIKKRARVRAMVSGRAVPEDLLQQSIDQVPKSVEHLW
jgi:adenylylsulfate kinase-like enzyme